MSTLPPPFNAPLASSELGHRAGGVSKTAARAGRELVWLLIAAAFCVVEALVFVTDLPVSKIFSRRDLEKSSGRGH